MNIKKIYDLVITINVHEKLDFLKEQLKNIAFFTKKLYVLIILNCNNFMFSQLSNIEFNEIDVIINPDIIDKKRWDGSLTKGIFSNLNHIFKEKIIYKYFLVLQSKNFFIKELTLENIKIYFETTTSKLNNFKNSNGKFYHNINYKHYKLLDKISFDKDLSFDNVKQEISNNRSYWIYAYPIVNKAIWFEHFYEKSNFIIGGKHEALCFPYDVCVNMNNYLNSNKDISSSIYKTKSAVEEIVPQTLAVICSTNIYSYSFICSKVITLTPVKNVNDKRCLSNIKDLYTKFKIVIN